MEQEKGIKEDEDGRGAEEMEGRKGCNLKASFWKCLAELRGKYLGQEGSRQKEPQQQQPQASVPGVPR